MYSAHRPGLSRHCSCRQGYREPCGVPNGGYYRPEGTLERRRLAYGAYEGPPQVYAEASVEKRRLCRSLSEGPYPYPPELGKPANGDFGYRAPGYREVVILEDPVLPALCSCPACEEKLALPTAALYGLRLEREAGEGWANEAGKPLLHPVRPGHPLPLLVPACGHHHAPVPDYSCLKPPKAGEEGHEGCSYSMCPEGSPEPPRSSPVPAFPLAASYDISGPTQPPLPEKRHLLGPGQQPGPWGPEQASPPARGTSHHVTFAPLLPDNAPQPPEPPMQESQSNVKFVQDTSKFWYKPHLSRDQAIALLKDKDPGAFLIRDSHSFQGAYGLALKVATPPPSAQPWKGDPLEQLVRHFLIETGPKGVKIKGCPSEPYFDPLEEAPEAPVPTNMSTAADLLRQGAACSVLYLTSVETESLTGPQAVARASSAALSCSPRPTPAIVHFKVSAQGITLTDNQRKLFFRRHYPVNSITFASTDPQDRRWTNPDGTTSKIFGFVAKKPGSPWENVCHLFAELDPDQPAGAIVTFITKVLLGQRK
ncbi:tensin-like C1 domain-containing phosphatase [Pontoporia blainvillei]|uniref:Tensin-like C1 domain-containing phosphatase n=1 Tax=Pontoporia blainvillei TaxID=48723 RepID=A0ABX0S8G9_PONBL|nr:tensin-like C1 domain-containing phosphatase [Pontoporia blainvillei]